VLQIYLQDPPLPREIVPFPRLARGFQESYKSIAHQSRGDSSPFTQSSQSCHGLSGKSKAPLKSFCTMRAILDPISDVLLLEEMIINHLAQMIFCEENSHRVSL